MATTTTYGNDTATSVNIFDKNYYDDNNDVSYPLPRGFYINLIHIYG